MDKKPYPSETQERFIVRLPDGMRDQIAEAAKAAGRSMNAEIVSRLQSSFNLEPLKADKREELVALVNAAVDERIEHITKTVLIGNIGRQPEVQPYEKPPVNTGPVRRPRGRPPK